MWALQVPLFYIFHRTSRPANRTSSPTACNSIKPNKGIYLQQLSDWGSVCNIAKICTAFLLICTSNNFFIKEPNLYRLIK